MFFTINVFICILVFAAHMSVCPFQLMSHCCTTPCFVNLLQSSSSNGDCLVTILYMLGQYRNVLSLNRGVGQEYYTALNNWQQSFVILSLKQNHYVKFQLSGIKRSGSNSDYKICRVPQSVRNPRCRMSIIKILSQERNQYVKLHNMRKYLFQLERFAVNKLTLDVKSNLIKIIKLRRYNEVSGNNVL